MKNLRESLKRIEKLQEQILHSPEVWDNIQRFPREAQRAYEDIIADLSRAGSFDNILQDNPRKLINPIRYPQIAMFVTYFSVPFVTAAVLYLLQADFVYIGVGMFAYLFVVLLFYRYKASVLRNQMEAKTLVYKLLKEYKKQS